MPQRLARCIAAALAIGSAAPVLAISCQDLRAVVDAKIRGSGVAQYSLNIVDAAASAPGKVVGTCELGAKKLVYLPAKPSGGTNAPPSRPAKAGPPILTECKDGSVSMGGECRP